MKINGLCDQKRNVDSYCNIRESPQTGFLSYQLLSSFPHSATSSDFLPCSVGMTFKTKAAGGTGIPGEKAETGRHFRQGDGEGWGGG